MGCVRLGIADSVAPTDDCLWVPAVGKPKPRTELVLVHVQADSTRRTGKHQSSRNAIGRRIGYVAVEPAYMVILLDSRRCQVITQPQVQGQFRRNFDIVLNIATVVPGTKIGGSRLNIQSGTAYLA